MHLAPRHVSGNTNNATECVWFSTFFEKAFVQASKELKKPFKTASAGMMLKTLMDLGFAFRNRRGKYSFAVPLLNEFIVRQMGLAAKLPVPFGDTTET